MKLHFQKLCALVSAVSVVVCAAALPVSAEGEQQQSIALPVELTSSQTLALYGSSIPAYYYDGTSVRSTTFEFYKSSKTLASDCSRVFSDGFLGVTEPANLFGFCWSSSIENWWISELVPSVNQGTWLINNSDGYIKAESIQPYEFLIYRAPISLNSVNQLDFDFQISFDFSIALDGVERFCTINAYSIATASSFANNMSVLPYVNCSNLRSTMNLYNTSSSTVPFGITSDCYANNLSNDYFGVAFHPLTTPDLSNIVDNHYTYWNDINKLFPCPAFSMCYFDSGNLASPSSLSSMSWDIFAASASIVHDDDYNVSDPSFQQAYTYLMLMCPVVWGDVSQPEPEPENPDYSQDLQNISSGVSVTNTKIDLVLQKLDQIYQQQYSQYNLLTNINNNITSIGTKIDNLGDTIINGIKGLFVPTQQDLLTFKLNLETQKNLTFAGMLDSETAFDTAFNRITRVSSTQYMRMPLIDLRPTVDFHLTAAQFPDFETVVEDGKEKVLVPLKPDQARWGWFYDLLAWAIDIVCTIAVVNMLANKLNGVIVGKKVVEIEDDC